MSWEVKRVGDVCEVIAGQSPEGQHYNAEGRGMPFYQGKKDFGEKYLESPTTWTGVTTKVAETNDILMSVRAPVGPVNFATQRVCIGRGLAAIRPKSINKDFLFYALLSKQDEISGREGAVFATINKTEIEHIELPTPPLPEQQRIVGKLDAAFAALSQAQAHVERNRANARELFESYLNGVFEGKGDGWVEKRLGDLGETRTGSTPPTNDRSNYGDYAPFVKPGDFNVDGSIEYRGDGVSKRGFELSRPIPANSILMVCVGATIGKTGFVDREVTSNQQINSLTPRSEFFPKYIYYALIARRFFEAVLHNSSQATLPIISKSKWENLTITLPKDRKAQEQFANELDELSMITKQLETTYQQKLVELAGLKKAVLGAAFRGEL